MLKESSGDNVKYMKIKSILVTFFVFFICFIMATPSFASVNITQEDLLNVTNVPPYICYNNTAFPYHTSYDSSGYFVNSSYVYNNITNKIFSETNISSILCYNTFLGFSSLTSNNQTITNNVTTLTAMKAHTAAWICAYKFTNITNFKDLYIYENKNLEYEDNSYNNVNKNYNVSTIIISPGKNIDFTVSFNPKNQTSPTSESGSIYYIIYFDYNDMLYYHYYGIININITTKEASYL